MRNIIALIGVVILFAGCKELAEKGSIGGKVTNAGTEQKGAIVLAIAGDSLANGQSIDYNTVKGTLIVNADGSYRILLVDEGTYVVVAINDNNDNLVFDDTLDEIGYYGHKDSLGLTIPDKVSIAKGEDKTGIDIDTLYVLP